ncbi:MAG: DUF2306 domain-containing protein [Pseudomonadota bacterium]
MDKTITQPTPGTAARVLCASAIIWFTVAAIGQFIFVYYIAVAYFPPLALEGLPGMADSRMPNGYVAGDLVGNLAAAAHVIIAAIIISGGLFQLTPAIRNRVPRFHRWTGRLYVVLAIVTSVAGMHMVWTRGTVGGFFAPYAITIVGGLIIVFSLMTIILAMRRQFDSHRRWAMRLFMVSSAVWFFRIWLMFWFMTTGGIGIDNETFTGPFITFTYFAQFMVPLGLLQLYFVAQDRSSPSLKYLTAGIVFLATGVTGIGIFAATMGMWLPEL